MSLNGKDKAKTEVTKFLWRHADFFEQGDTIRFSAKQGAKIGINQLLIQPRLCESGN